MEGIVFHIPYIPWKAYKLIVIPVQLSFSIFKFSNKYPFLFFEEMIIKVWKDILDMKKCFSIVISWISKNVICNS